VAGAPVDTDQGTNVYIEPDGDLTLTESTNVFYGTVNYPKGFARVIGKLPIKVGG
jgi:hypothetical protein